MTSSADAWTPVKVELAYRLGEIPLFSWPLSGYAMRRHFTLIAPYANTPSPEVAGAPASDFLFYPCYPVSQDPPVVQRYSRWLVYTPYSFNNRFVDLRSIGTFDAYLQQFSSKSRSTLQRKVRKFEQSSQGRIDCRLYRTSEEVAEFLRIARPLSAGTYQARLLGAGLPESPEFQNHAVAMAAAGRVRAMLLFLNQAPVAFVFCFCTDGVATFDYVGFDTQFRELSPGTVLQFMLLQNLFSDGDCSIFDFTEGENEQKRLFGTSFQRCAKSYVFRYSIRAALAVTIHRRLNTMTERLGAWLHRFGLKAKLRALIRRTA